MLLVKMEFAAPQLLALAMLACTSAGKSPAPNNKFFAERKE
jgi:hypothetical protein